MTTNGTVLPPAPKTQDGYSEEKIQFLQNVFDLIRDEGFRKGCSKDTKVLDFHHPEELKTLMEVDISEEGCNETKILELCKKALCYSVRTSHPYFANQLFSHTLPVAQAGAHILEALNTNVHTFETAPVLSVIEHHLVKEMSQVVGYGDDVDGVVMPGGTLTNMMGFHVARYTKFPETKRKGIAGCPPLVIFTSEMGHYSVDRGANFMGLGTDSVVMVKTKPTGGMCPDDLELKVKQHQAKGSFPYLVNATCGTTVLGAFDPLDAIADVCQRHNMWLHVDICFGAGALFATRMKKKVQGIHRSNSLALSFHKALHSSVQCNLLLVRDKEALRESISDPVPYLFQPDKCYDTSYDLGKKTVMCGRKGDAFKMWLSWKFMGHSGFREMMDRNLALVDILCEKIRERKDDYRLVLSEYEYVAVSFWYIPPSMRGQDENEDWWQKMDKVAPVIKERMMKGGTVMIGYQPVPSMKFVNFFRIILNHAQHTEADLEFFLDEIHRLGKDL